eukprot:5879218-Prymnesium_polylepis.1
MGSAARAVCAQRYFAGDKLKQWGAYAEEILETQGCAYGCSCRSTWSHTHSFAHSFAYTHSFACMRRCVLVGGSGWR